eukprot:scaffold23464_cov126-Cylindrotheca_fusiformis.AAC.3
MTREHIAPAIDKSSRIGSTWRTHLRRLSEENVVANFDEDDDTSFETLTTITAEEAEGSIDTWTPPQHPQQQQNDMEYDEDEIDSYFHSPQYGFQKLNDHDQSENESFLDGGGTSDEVMDDCDGESSDGSSIDIVAEMFQLHNYGQTSSPQQQSNFDSSPEFRARGEHVLVSSPTNGETAPARLVMPVQELLLFRPSSKWSPSSISAYSFFENDIPPNETIQIQRTGTGKSEWIAKQYIHLSYNEDAESIDSDSTAPAMNTTTSLDTALAGMGQHSFDSDARMDSGSFLGSSIACDQSCSGRPIMKCKDNIVVVSDNDEEEEVQPPGPASSRNPGRKSTSPPPHRGLLFRLSHRSFAGGATANSSVDGPDSSIASLDMKSSSSQKQHPQEKAHEGNDDCDMIPESPTSVSTAESFKDESPTRTESTTSVAADADQPSSVPNQEPAVTQELTLDDSPSARKLKEGLPVRRLSMKRILQSDLAASPPSPPPSTESPRRATTTPKEPQQPERQQPATVSTVYTSTSGELDSVTISRRKSSLLQQQEKESIKASSELVSRLHSARKQACRASAGNEILQELSKSMSTRTTDVGQTSFRKHAREASIPDFTVVDPALMIPQGATSTEDSPRTNMTKAREGLTNEQLSIKRKLRSDSSLSSSPPPPPPSESVGRRTPDSTTDSSSKKTESKSSSPKRAHRGNSSVGSPATGRATKRRKSTSEVESVKSNSLKNVKDKTVPSELPSSISNQNEPPQQDDKEKRKKKPKRRSSKSWPTISTFRKSSSKDRRTRGSKSQKVNMSPSSSPAESSVSSSRKRAKKKKDRPNSDSRLGEVKKRKKKKSKRKSESKKEADAGKLQVEGEQKSSTSKGSSSTRSNKNKRRLQVESNFQSLNDKMSSTVGVGAGSRSRSSGPSTAGVRSSLRKSLLQKRKAVLQSRQKLKDTFKRIVGGGNGAGGDDMPVPHMT